LIFITAVADVRAKTDPALQAILKDCHFTGTGAKLSPDEYKRY
jgi:hypothetical protein